MIIQYKSQYNGTSMYDSGPYYTVTVGEVSRNLIYRRNRQMLDDVSTKSPDCDEVIGLIREYIRQFYPDLSKAPNTIRM